MAHADHRLFLNRIRGIMSFRIGLSGLVFWVAFSAFAGSTQTEIVCRSASGRTLIQAFIPGEAEDAMVKLTVDGKSCTYLNGMAVTTLELNGRDPKVEYPGYELAAIGSAVDTGMKVIAIQVLRKDNYDTEVFSLIANPATVKIRDTDVSTKGTFTAQARGHDPRAPGGRYLSVEVTCSYDYSI